MAACPYDAIFINPEDHSAEKCNFCAHRLDVGLEPACVVVCPTQAIMVGDMNDPDPRSPQIIHRDAVAVRRPEKETRPKLFYKGAHQATLDPLAARRPDGGLFMWSEQGSIGGQVARRTSGALEQLGGGAAVLRRPAPGALGLAGEPVHLDEVDRGRRLPHAACSWALLGLVHLGGLDTWGVTVPGVASRSRSWPPGCVLIWDLEHPERFWMILPGPSGAAGWCAAGSSSGRTGRPDGCTWASRSWRTVRTGPALAVDRRPAGGDDRRLHGVPVRPGQGPRPVAEPAAARPPRWCRPSLAGAAVLLLRAGRRPRRWRRR